MTRSPRRRWNESSRTSTRAARSRCAPGLRRVAVLLALLAWALPARAAPPGINVSDEPASAIWSVSLQSGVARLGDALATMVRPRLRLAGARGELVVGAPLW